MLRVWGKRPDEADLEWFYEKNPVRPALVLLAEEDDRVVGSVAISSGASGSVGYAVDLATDPAYRGRGVFSELQAANEERAREAGMTLLLTVPTPASARILTGKLGWTKLPPVRMWARPRVSRAERIARVGDAWHDWRFADAPRDYARAAGSIVRRRGLLDIAIPQPGQRDRYLLAGFVPTPKTFTLLGKSLDGSPLPERVDVELGDLDFM